MQSKLVLNSYVRSLYIYIVEQLSQDKFSPFIFHIFHMGQSLYNYDTRSHFYNKTPIDISWTYLALLHFFCHLYQFLNSGSEELLTSFGVFRSRGFTWSLVNDSSYLPLWSCTPLTSPWKDYHYLAFGITISNHMVNKFWFPKNITYFSLWTDIFITMYFISLWWIFVTWKIIVYYIGWW